MWAMEYYVQGKTNIRRLHVGVINAGFDASS